MTPSTALAAPDPMHPTCERAECPRYGQPHLRPDGQPGACTGHRKSDKAPCPNPRVTGTTKCRMHGSGKGSPGRRAGERRLASAEAARSLSELGYEQVTEPLDALAEIASQAVRLSEHFAAKVAELEEYRYRSDIGTEQLRSELSLLKDWMSFAQKCLADWVRLGFEERKARLDDARAQLVAVALAGALRELGLDPESPVVLGALDRWMPVLDGAPQPAPIEVDVVDEGSET